MNPASDLIERPLTGPSLQVLLDRVGTLPSLPATALALLQLGDASEASLATLTRIVQNDPAVTVRVLRVANSAFYGVPGGVLTVPDAVVVLGSSTLRALALTAALAPALPMPAHPAFQPAPFWRAALACAVLSSAFAERARVPADTAFTAGLLHNLGVLAWCSVDPASFAALSAHAAHGETSTMALCRARLGWDPFALGACLAQRWGLPLALSGVIGALGEPQCNDHGHPQGALLSVLRVAMVLAEQLSVSGVMVLAALVDPATDAAHGGRDAGGTGDAGGATHAGGVEAAVGTEPFSGQLLQDWIDRACPQGSAAQVALQSLAMSPSQLLRCLRRAAGMAGSVDALVG